MTVFIGSKDGERNIYILNLLVLDNKGCALAKNKLFLDLLLLFFYSFFALKIVEYTIFVHKECN